MPGRKKAKTSATADELVEDCLATLRSIGPSVQADFSATAANGAAEGELRFDLGHAGRIKLPARVVRSHLSYTLASGLVDQMTKIAKAGAVLCRYVPTKIGEQLATNGLSYVDAAGNCHLQKSDQLLVHVEGKKPSAREKKSGAQRSELPAHLRAPGATSTRRRVSARCCNGGGDQQEHGRRASAVAG